MGKQGSASGKRRGPGRPPLRPGQRAKRTVIGVSLRPEDAAALRQLAELVRLPLVDLLRTFALALAKLMKRKADELAKEHDRLAGKKPQP